MITGWALITITVFSTGAGFPPGDTGMVIHKIFESKGQCEEEKARIGPSPAQRHECIEIR